MKGNNHSKWEEQERKTEEWADFDGLPPVLRSVLHESPVDWCGTSVRELLDEAMLEGLPKGLATVRVAVIVSECNEEEIQQFATVYWGGESPHLAANVKIQSYGHRAKIGPKVRAR